MKTWSLLATFYCSSGNPNYGKDIRFMNKNEIFSTKKAEHYSRQSKLELKNNCNRDVILKNAKTKGKRGGGLDA